MKRTIVASLLGVAASVCVVASSHAQGYVIFENYNGGNLNAPVTFGTTASVGGINGTAGVAVGSEFTASLWYSLDSGATFTQLTQTAANAGPSYPTAFLSTDGNTASGAGYFTGPTVTIPGYTSGSIVFKVQADATGWTGISAPFTTPSLAAGTPAPPAGDFGPAMQGFTVNPVPEPGIFALAGLAAAGLMGIRRKKQ